MVRLHWQEYPSQYLDGQYRSAYQWDNITKSINPIPVGSVWCPVTSTIWGRQPTLRGDHQSERFLAVTLLVFRAYCEVLRVKEYSSVHSYLVF
jgi:hypothetical protein